MNPSFSTAIPTTLREVGMRSPPGWVAGFSKLSSPACDQQDRNLFIGVEASPAFSRVAACVPDAGELPAEALREQTRQAYSRIFEILNDRAAAHPVRFWNFIPNIHGRMAARQTRYMVFNAGRFLAYQDHYGDSDVFDRNVAAASGVGHHGTDLWIHCLAAAQPGVHLGNPRQVSPHRYSARFGHLPPCFARATLLPSQSTLLIAGTASICGEESLHDDLTGQLDETLANLAAVIETGRSKMYTDFISSQDGSEVRHSAGSSVQEFASSTTLTTGANGEIQALLKHLTDLRIYYPRPSDLRRLNDQLVQRLGHHPRLEFIRADLCRSELLVEIEAIADLSA